MIFSMTAFGRAHREEAGYSVTVEMKTLNHRYLDIVLRLPKNLSEFEEPCRKLILSRMRRGRVEVYVQIESVLPEHKTPQIDTMLARHYWQQLQTLHRLLPGCNAPGLEHLLRIPYLFETRETVDDRDVLRGQVMGGIEEALEQVNRMRATEGESMLKDCLERISFLRRELSLIESRKELVVQEYRKRLQDRMQELLGDIGVDEGRLLQEVACMAERSDINEEIVRLASHMDQMQSLLSGRDPADGRRLDFLTQELHREANTIGSKTTDMEILQAVVQMKTEIGKLKEQVQNIE
ncbi:MAG: YicC family protein [Syntrophobacteraceae bacterium]|nr:YicC family protein [Syntrophobacteraceae bacterium]